jgi:hypothetical protein
METFQDCIDLSKRIIALNTDNITMDFPSEDSLERFVNMKVEVCHARMITTKEMEQSNEQIGITTISSQQDPADLLRESNGMRHCQHDTSFCFIVIDPINYECVTDQFLDDELNLYSNLIILNYGMAHCVYAEDIRLSSQSNDNQDLIHQIRQQAFYMLCVCESFFKSRLGTSSPFHFQQSTVLLASFLLTKKQGQLSSQLEYDTSLTDFYNNALKTLLPAIDAHRKILPVKPNFAARAA